MPDETAKVSLVVDASSKQLWAALVAPDLERNSSTVLEGLEKTVEA